ncbi:MAG: hypothetical protein DMD79_23055 [Candidatus Rokuibacteriota bacterium]|nr:MAG: hypothetical protein DMD79_23055 [Candidatus Rokubacteria bacterium]
MKAYFGMFLSVFLAELGDKTQLATLTLAASPGVARLGVFLAAGAALLLSTAIAVGVGDAIARWVSPAHLRTAAGLGFLVIGAWILWGRS